MALCSGLSSSGIRIRSSSSPAWSAELTDTGLKSSSSRGETTAAMRPLAAGRLEKWKRIIQLKTLGYSGLSGPGCSKGFVGQQAFLKSNWNVNGGFFALSATSSSHGYGSRLDGSIRKRDAKLGVPRAVAEDGESSSLAQQALRFLPALVLGLGVMLSLRPGHALANVAEEVFSPQGKGLFASAWAGLVAGGLHTLTGPDHLAALAPLCIGRSRIQSAAVGALWGCGHDAGQIIFGLIFLVLKDKLHIELIRTWASRIVGLTLITIGGIGIYESQEPLAVLAEDGGGQGGGGDPAVRIKNDSKNATTFATGVVYGLQPDALLMILPALALPSRATGAAFLVMFLLGTILAMGSYTLFISSFSHALQKRLPGITKNLSVGSSIIAIALGLALVASELLGFSIF